MQKKYLALILICLGMLSCKNILEKVAKEQGIKLYRGYDIEGRLNSCVYVEKENQACTAVYGPEDKFADDCRNEGAKAYQCGCHSYLCSRKISSNAESKPTLDDPQPEPKPEPKPPLTPPGPGDDGSGVLYEGYNPQGVKTSCRSKIHLMLCPAVFTPGHQFAADCRQKGHRAYQCDCSNFLCSDKVTASTNKPEQPGRTVTYEGYNWRNKFSSCKIVPGVSVFCAVSPPWAEAYKKKCQMEGGKVSACHCQNYLCSKNVRFVSDHYRR